MINNNAGIFTLSKEDALLLESLSDDEDRTLLNLSFSAKGYSTSTLYKEDARTINYSTALFDSTAESKYSSLLKDNIPTIIESYSTCGDESDSMECKNPCDKSLSNLSSESESIMVCQNPCANIDFTKAEFAFYQSSVDEWGLTGPAITQGLAYKYYDFMDFNIDYQMSRENNYERVKALREKKQKWYSTIEKNPEIGYLDDTVKKEIYPVLFSQPEWSKNPEIIKPTGWEGLEEFNLDKFAFRSEHSSSSETSPRVMDARNSIQNRYRNPDLPRQGRPQTIAPPPLLKVGAKESLNNYAGRPGQYVFPDGENRHLTAIQTCLVDNLWMSYKNQNPTWFHNSLRGLADYFINGRENRNFNFYLVTQGNDIGIFSSWPECMKAIQGHEKPLFRGYVTYEQAYVDAVSILGNLDFKVPDEADIKEKEAAAKRAQEINALIQENEDLKIQLMEAEGRRKEVIQHMENKKDKNKAIREEFQAERFQVAQIISNEVRAGLKPIQEQLKVDIISQRNLIQDYIDFALEEHKKWLFEEYSKNIGDVVHGTVDWLLYGEGESSQPAQPQQPQDLHQPD